MYRPPCLGGQCSRGRIKLSVGVNEVPLGFIIRMARVRRGVTGRSPRVVYQSQGDLDNDGEEKRKGISTWRGFRMEGDSPDNPPSRACALASQNVLLFMYSL